MRPRTPLSPTTVLLLPLVLLAVTAGCAQQDRAPTEAVALLETGLDPAGDPLAPPMPRFRMTREDAEAAWRTSSISTVTNDGFDGLTGEGRGRPRGEAGRGDESRGERSGGR